jgi:arylsulfatase A-like enzyme
MSDKRPNILFILTDQQHIDTISALGNPFVQTPAIDRFVRAGVSFRQSYCTNPVCSPARSSLFTGRPSSETGVYQNGIGIREGMPTLGECLREQGYETLYAGKWHVPGCYVTNIPGFRVLSTGIGHQGTVSDPLCTDACVNYLYNKADDAPFCMVVSYMQPHDICEWLRLNRIDQGTHRYPEIASQLPDLPDNLRAVPEGGPQSVTRLRERREPATGNWSEAHWRYYLWAYLRHVEMVDAEVDRLLDALDDTGMREDTIIVYTSDHGEGMGGHGMTRKNTLYDEAARVPLIFSWPGTIREGCVEETTLACGLDIMPTLCDYAGVAIPQGVKGTSLRAVLKGDGVPGRAFIAAEVSSNLGQMIRSQRYKYVAYVDDNSEMLFDMQADPGETINLAHDPAYAAVLAQHRAMLREWIAGLDVAPNVPLENRWFVSDTQKTPKT